MKRLVDIYNKVDIVKRYHKAIMTADIIQSDIDSFQIRLYYKSNEVIVSFYKNKFLWSWKVTVLKPRYHKIEDYTIGYLDEIVFASKMCDIFCDKLPLLKGGDWYEKDYNPKPDVSYGFIKRSKCERYLVLDKGNISRRSLRILLDDRNIPTDIITRVAD